MSNTNNKILNSEYKNIIDNELKKGTPYRKLSQKLKDEYSFEVSHSALAEYHKKYLQGEINKPEIEQLEVEEEDMEEIEYNPDTPNSEVLKTVFQRQLQIFSTLQDKYMKGQRRFPEQELKALKMIDELLKSNGVERRIASEIPENAYPEWNPYR